MELLPRAEPHGPAAPWLGGFEFFRKKQAGGWSFPQRCSSPRQGPALPRQGPAQLGLSKLLVGRIAVSSVLVEEQSEVAPSLRTESVLVCAALPQADPFLSTSLYKPGIAPLHRPSDQLRKKN